MEKMFKNYPYTNEWTKSDQVTACWREYRIQENIEKTNDKNFIYGYLHSEGESVENTLAEAIANKVKYDAEIAKLKAEISDANFRLAELQKDAKANQDIITAFSPTPLEKTIAWQAWKNQESWYTDHWFVNV